MRDIETIDAELQLLLRAWRVARVLSDRIPSTAHIDELLDERAAALDRALSRPAANSPGSAGNSGTGAIAPQYPARPRGVPPLGAGSGRAF